MVWNMLCDGIEAVLGAMWHGTLAHAVAAFGPVSQIVSIENVVAAFGLVSQIVSIEKRREGEEGED